jgi:hypothetical protein
MLCGLVERVTNPGVVVLAALFRGTLPGFLFAGEGSEGAGAQGDTTVFGVPPLPPSRATMIGHIFHVSEVYRRNLINAIRFHLDNLDFVL